MREIKFRKWLKASKAMEYNPQLGGKGSINSVFTRHSEDEVWMQYIGIKDKNGKDIYEGDILKHVWVESFIKDFGVEIQINSSGMVTNSAPFKGGETCYELKFIIRSGDLYDCGYGYIVGWYFDKDPEKSEVIGNIYDNPEIAKDIK